jgi:hypothetical protein
MDLWMFRFRCIAGNITGWCSGTATEGKDGRQLIRKRREIAERV